MTAVWHQTLRRVGDFVQFAPPPPLPFREVSQHRDAVFVGPLQLLWLCKPPLFPVAQDAQAVLVDAQNFNARPIERRVKLPPRGGARRSRPEPALQILHREEVGQLSPPADRK